MPKSPIIPKSVWNDRDNRNLMTQWRNCLIRHRVCRQRVHWTTNKATIEKNRRKESWKLIARVLEIETLILTDIAKATHHPDLWSTSGRDSVRRTLLNDYNQNRRVARYLTGDTRKKNVHRRKKLVQAIRNLERQWMIALFELTNPGEHIPSAIPMHWGELRPRKVRAAMAALNEFARPIDDTPLEHIVRFSSGKIKRISKQRHEEIMDARERQAR